METIEDRIVISPVDHREISLQGMSRKEIQKLHYTEETEMAKRILACRPFSEQRKQLLNSGYAFVETLKLLYESNQGGSFGSTPASIKLVKDIITNRQSNKEKKQIVYEAGVGTGCAVKELSALSDVDFYGCDVTLLPSVKKIIQRDSSLHIRENTLYDDLADLEDGWIDVFYADNVIEHMIPDEVPFILKRLNKKMKRGGQLVLFVPNKYMGPGDISKYYLPKGHKATGFHFMEMGYGECIRLAVSCGFKPKWIVKKSVDGYSVEKDWFFIKNGLRILQEQFIRRVDKVYIRMELFSANVFQCYVFEK